MPTPQEIIDVLKKTVSGLIEIIKEMITEIKNSGGIKGLVNKSITPGNTGSTGTTVSTGTTGQTPLNQPLNQPTANITGTPGMISGTQSQSKIFKILIAICLAISIFILIGVAINIFNYGSSSSTPTGKEDKKKKQNKNNIHILPGLFNKEDEVITLYTTKKIEYTNKKSKKSDKDKCENINNNIDDISKKYMANGKISTPSNYKYYTNEMGIEINKCNRMKECKLNPNAITINKCSKLTTTTTTTKSENTTTTTTENSSDANAQSFLGKAESGANDLKNDLKSIFKKFNTNTTPLIEGLPDISSTSSGLESSVDPNNGSSNSNNSSKTGKSKKSHKKEDIEAYQCQSEFFYSFINHVDETDENKSIKNGEQISSSLCNGSCTLDNKAFNLNYGKISDSNNNINTYANTNYLYYTYKQSDLNKTKKNTIYGNYSLPIINDTMSNVKDYKVCLHNSEYDKKEKENDSGFSILFG